MNSRRRQLLLAGISLSAVLAGVADQKMGPPFRHPTLDHSLLQAGDWLFRRTNSLPGHLSSHLDPVGEFSHVGVIAPSSGGWKVVHAEPTRGYRGGRVNAEAVDVFVSQSDTVLVAQASLSYITLEQREQMAIAAQSFVGRPFDGLFDSSDDQALYCTELVWRAALVAGISLDRPLRPFSTVFGIFDLVNLSTLATQPGLLWVQRATQF